MSRRLLPVLAFAVLAVLLLIGLRNSPDKSIIDSPLIGRPAPNFELPDFYTDGTISKQELLGKPYLLNVWASWCPECRVEHDMITDIADSGLIDVYGFNYKDAPDDAARWLQQFGDPYHRIMVDLEGRTAIDFGVYGAPETFLIDAAGVIRYKHISALNSTVWEQELLPLIQSLPVKQVPSENS